MYSTNFLMAKEKNSIPTRIPKSMFDELDRALTKDLRIS